MRGVAGDADECRAKEFVAEFVAAANLFEHLVVWMLQGFDAAERFVDSGVELRANGFNRLYVEATEGVIHLLDDEFDAGPELSHIPVGLEGEGEIVEHAEERLDGRLDGIVANVLALLGFALAGVVELGLEAGKAVLRLRELKGELIAVVAELLGVEVDLLALGSGFDICVRVFGLRRSVRSVRCSWNLPFC